MLISRVPVRLVLGSALMLFLELALIRWLGANILHLSYFSNIVLLGSFLGIGLGFLRSRQGAQPPIWFPPLLAVMVMGVLAAPVGVDRTNSDLIFFTSLSTTGPPAWVVLPVVFVIVAAVLFGPGYLVGQCFFELPRLTAYRFDLIGSLIGIAAFTALSFLGAPSLVWGVVVGVLTLVLYWPAPRSRADGAAAARFAPVSRVGLVLASLSVVALVGALAWETSQPGVRWSPYYKIETQPQMTTIGEFTTIIANGVPHQAVTDVDARVGFEPFYAVPYQRSERTDPGRVLIVGAGTGTDVALALRQGATQRGRGRDRPADPRDRPGHQPEQAVRRPAGDASTSTTAGRSSSRPTGPTTPILFALPDSLTLVAGASQLRLESYLFTEPAMQRVSELLADDGVFAMYNYYREPWLVGRLGATMAAAFGHAPCIDLNRDYNSAVLVVSADESMQRCSPEDESAALIAGAPAPVDDNRPFLYLRTPHIPGFYLAVLAMILGISLRRGPGRGGQPAADPAVRGPVPAGRGVPAAGDPGHHDVRAAVRHHVAGQRHRVRRDPRGGAGRRGVHGVDEAHGSVGPDLPADRLRGAAGLDRRRVADPAGVAAAAAGAAADLVAATAITFMPVFTANVVFASRFDEAPEPSIAFGVNLLGAMLGGALEYLALLIGYRELLLVAAVLYVGALALGTRARRGESVAVG